VIPAKAGINIAFGSSPRWQEGIKELESWKKEPFIIKTKL